MIVTASNGHFFTQIPQPIHNSSEIDAVLKNITYIKEKYFYRKLVSDRPYKKIKIVIALTAPPGTSQCLTISIVN